ncbi:MAG TPA: HAMP domain-containing sensor histidine kinase [Chitinophagaceae bacterium]|nr:HAMP domain-containing sensor histidine kinase [Chitinophagaceae bacterium]
MNSNLRIIIALCTLALAGAISLQAFWLKNYFEIGKERFIKETSIALEDAIKKEASVRYDSIEQRLFEFVIDTANIGITSAWDKGCSAYIHSFINKDNPDDRFSFVDKDAGFPVVSEVDRLKVAALYARIYRLENLERKSTFFQTRNISRHLDQLLNRYGFDTANLRPVFKTCLAERMLPQAFSFAPENATAASITTKPLPTDKTSDAKTVQAFFEHSNRNIISKMMWPLVGSLLILLLVGFALYYLARTLYRQKRLTTLKNDFISNISHELKTPLATVSAAIESIDSFNVMEDAAKTKKYLAISKNEIGRLSSLIDKILNISIYERQHFELCLEEIDIDILIKELIENYKTKDKKNIRFVYKNESPDTLIKADKLHLYQALSNLVENASKYSVNEVQIDICFYSEREHLVIEVKDNGIGISRKDLPYIYDKFYRVPSGNKHRVRGYGLGLFYVKCVMERHAGWCKAESNKGEGTIFKLGIPNAG